MRKRDLMITLFLSIAVLFLCQTGLASPLFNVRLDFGAGEDPFSVAMGDLDGDGTLDLAVANRDSDNVSVLLGNGDGTFQSAINYGAGNVPSSVAIGDLDGDGALDLAVANWNRVGSVSVFLGNGDGTFQSAINYRGGSYPSAVSIGDLNGDGALDLAMVHVAGYLVSVLLGNGDGTFQSAVNYGAGGDPTSVALGDLDGDGALDLAVAGWPESVFFGNGDGTFRSAINYGAGHYAHSVAIGDLDGDGVLDLAVAGGGNVSVLINSLDKVETGCPKGWSMISLPVDPINKRLNKLFPDAVVVYGYKPGTGYVRVQPYEELEIGKGYWILLDAEKTYAFTGQSIPSYTHPVSSDGWAMIGGCSSLAQASSNNCNIGVIYRYVQGSGYQQVTGHLEPGDGYWILLNNVDGEATISVESVDHPGSL